MERGRGNFAHVRSCFHLKLEKWPCNSYAKIYSIICSKDLDIHDHSLSPASHFLSDILFTSVLFLEANFLYFHIPEYKRKVLSISR